MDRQTGVDAAIAAAGGSQAALASALGVSEAVVSVWVKRGWVPWRRSLEIERRFGVPRADLLSPDMQRLLRPVAV